MKQGGVVAGGNLWWEVGRKAEYWCWDRRPGTAGGRQAGRDLTSQAKERITRQLAGGSSYCATAMQQKSESSASAQMFCFFR